MIITLSGYPGSGKSTVKNALAAALHLKKYSAGDMRGKMAMARGITIDQLNEIGMTDSSTDLEADKFQENLGKTEDDFVIDGRVSYHFIPQSIKIFLTVDPQVAAERVFAARAKAGSDRGDEPAYASVEAAKRSLMERFAHDRARYQKWYGIDFWDESQYDLVLDTTGRSPAETTQKILDFVAARQKDANS